MFSVWLRCGSGLYVGGGLNWLCVSFAGFGYCMLLCLFAVGVYLLVGLIWCLISWWDLRLLLFGWYWLCGWVLSVVALCLISVWCLGFAGLVLGLGLLISWWAVGYGWMWFLFGLYECCALCDICCLVRGVLGFDLFLIGWLLFVGDVSVCGFRLVW